MVFCPKHTALMVIINIPYLYQHSLFKFKLHLYSYNFEQHVLASKNKLKIWSIYWKINGNERIILTKQRVVLCCIEWKLHISWIQQRYVFLVDPPHPQTLKNIWKKIMVERVPWACLKTQTTIYEQPPRTTNNEENLNALFFRETPSSWKLDLNGIPDRKHKKLPALTPTYFFKRKFWSWLSVLLNKNSNIIQFGIQKLQIEIQCRFCDATTRQKRANSEEVFYFCYDDIAGISWNNMLKNQTGIIRRTQYIIMVWNILLIPFQVARKNFDK